MTSQFGNETALSPKEIRRRCPLILLNEVEPGDVLLTRGNKAHSAGVAWATQGVFSHAAIWLPAINTPGLVALAESDGLGVGYTPLKLITIDRNDGTGRQLAASLPTGTTKYKLVYHPDLEKLTEEQVRDASDRLTERFLHKSYSSLARLVDAADLTDPLRSVALAALSTADRLRRPNLESGPFCSEFVASFFEELELPALSRGRRAGSVAPNDFDPERSLLRERPRVFIDRNEVTDAIVGWESDIQRMLGAQTREGQLPSRVEDRERARRFAETMRGLEQETASKRKELRSSGERIFEEISKAAEVARSTGDQVGADKLDRLSATQLLLIHLDRRIAYEETHNEKVDDNNPLQVPRSDPSLVWLKAVHDRVSSTITYRYRRYQLNRVLVAKCRASAREESGRRKDTPHRRALRNLRDLRREYYKADQMIKKIMETIKPSFPYVNKIVEATQDAALVESGRLMPLDLDSLR